jgi:thioredoxin 1
LAGVSGTAFVRVYRPPQQCSIPTEAQSRPLFQRSKLTEAKINPFSTLCIRRRLNRVSSPHIVHTTDATFSQDVLKSEKPVLLDFWAEWCGPCKMIAPILDEIATEYQDRIKIAKLNIDENPQTPPKFGIRGIPTLILFKNGTVEAQKVGAVSKSQLSAFLDSNL